MSKIQLTLACGDYDRTRPLWDGSVQPEGLELNVLLLPVEEIFLRMVRSQDFEVSELSMSSFLITRSKGSPEFVAIPAFPSRKFRHTDIYIRSGSAMKRPQDLAGKRIGLPEYQMTAAVWVRGILQEFYDVNAGDVKWFTAHEERFPIVLPPSIDLTIIPEGENLFDLLQKGELDAIITARTPTPFLRGEGWITRLFPDSKEVELGYYRTTGIFPIMHTVVMRKDVYDRYPWVAQSLYKAFCRAKDRTLEQMLNLGAPPVTLPWFFQEIEQTISCMGKNFWSYGVEDNRKTLDKLIHYMRQQGLLPSGFQPTVESLFAENILE